MSLDLITVIIAILGPAVGAVAAFAVLREKVLRHDRSIEDIGRRVGALEQEAAVTRSELSRPHTIGGKP